MRQGLTTSCRLLDHDQHEHEEVHLARGCGNRPGMAHSSGLLALPPKRQTPAYPASAFDAANAGHDWQARSVRWHSREMVVACPLDGLVSRFHASLKDHSAEDRCSWQFGTTSSDLSPHHHGKRRRSRDIHHEQESYGILTVALPASLLTEEQSKPVWL